MQKPFVKWGLIAATFGVVYTLLVYLVNPAAINSLSAGLIPMIAMIFCASKASLEERAMRGGYMSWGQALMPSFLTIAIYFIISMLFSYVLTNFIDPSLIEEQTEAALEMQEKMMNMFGGEMTDDMIEELRARAEPSLMNVLMGTFWAMLCFALPISAIIALFIQKKNPENDLV